LKFLFLSFTFAMIMKKYLHICRLYGLLILACSLFLSLSACWDAVLYNHNRFPETPTNFGDLNSSFDDYNSAFPPVLGETFPLYFSSNRRTGKDFDIIGKIVDMKMDRKDGILLVQENTSLQFGTDFGARQPLHFALEHINTQNFDELGPYIVGLGSRFYSSSVQGFTSGYIVMFANNSSGNLDIKFTHNLGTNFSEASNIAGLNSSRDDAYPSFSSDTSAVYFCSNRAGTFDIYHAKLPKILPLFAPLADIEPSTVQKDTILSSSFEDKCPFIERNIMVFASNRAGGFGGFDLYYSVWKNGAWTSPINFGSRINTEYDEYRPIIKNLLGFANQPLVFSSNRKGGKGGFDLYYVGVSLPIR
jgi:hypothetical protein